MSYDAPELPFESTPLSFDVLHHAHLSLEKRLAADPALAASALAQTLHPTVNRRVSQVFYDEVQHHLKKNFSKSSWMNSFCHQVATWLITQENADSQERLYRSNNYTGYRIKISLEREEDFMKPWSSTLSTGSLTVTRQVSDDST